MRNNIFLLLFSLFSWVSHLNGQEIVSIDLAGEITKTTGQLLLLGLGVNTTLDTGIDIYRVTYNTRGSDGNPDVASGLFMLPSEIDGPLPIMIYQHGTTDGKDDVPSNLQGGYQLGAIFAGKGMAVLAPDFLGMGVSKGFHPYVHADTEASAAVDMLEALRSYMTTQEIEWNDQLFITGYSQGGHAAMAVHRYLQFLLPDKYTVTASLPMSGPYSLSGVMRDVAFGDGPFSFPAYMVYSTRALKEINPFLYEDESVIFKEEFLPAIEEFIASGNGLFDLNESLVASLIANYGSAIPKELFLDSFRTVVESENNHPFNIALRESDLYDWTPEAPVLMLYCTSDDQVSYRNSIVADSVMNLNGAEDVRAVDVSGGESLDHSECIVPALNEGIPWVFSFVDTSTPTIEIAQNVNLRLFPNPTDGLMTVISSERVHYVEIYSITGRKVYYSNQESEYLQIELGGLTKGIYLAHIYTDSGVSIKKISRL